MIVTTADLYTIAYGKYAIGAYNLDNLEQPLGLFKGSLESQAPLSLNCQKALGNTPTMGFWKSSFEKSRRDIPVCLGSFSSITLNSPLSDRLAQLLWKNTSSLSPPKPQYLIQPDS